MSSFGWTLCSILVLTGATFFLSVNLISLRLFSRAKLQEAFKSINKEKLAEVLVENTEKFILSCSVYRLILNIVILLLISKLFISGTVGALVLIDYVTIFIIGAVVFVVFGLGVPYTWARYKSEIILSRTYRSLVVLSAVTGPILALLKLYDKVVRRLAGIVDSTPQEQQEEKQEEFLTDLEQQKNEGVFDEEEQEMIENVLELSDTTADEIMTPRTDIVAVEVDSSLEKILETINAAGHTRLPVYEENIDNILGFIYAKDLLDQIGKRGEDFNLREKLRKPYFVPESKPLRTLLHEFQNQKLHIAVLLDEYGGTTGIVTLEDILEELVGEIADEYEQTPAAPIKKIDSTTLEVDARTYVDDLNDQFELHIPEDEDYDTIGGFVFSHLGYIPKSGISFDYEDLKFVIISAEARKIKRIKIQKAHGPKTC
ncbi:hemolysin family protein [Planctomycetota bacterium]